MIFTLKKIVHESHRIHMDELSPTIYYVLTREVGRRVWREGEGNRATP